MGTFLRGHLEPHEIILSARSLTILDLAPFTNEPLKDSTSIDNVFDGAAEHLYAS